jgi:esterase/lipase superfamily enzyme
MEYNHAGSPDIPVVFSEKCPFGHLVLAAPDIDTRVFRDLARVYVKVAARTTLYASSKNRALASSGIVHDHPRAGYTPPLTVIPAIDTVEVSNIDLIFLGHGYFAEARELLHDLHDLLINDLPPERRMGLRATVATAGERSWVIQA